MMNRSTTKNLTLFFCIVLLLPLETSLGYADDAIKQHFEEFFKENYRYIPESNELEIKAPYIIECLETKKTQHEIRMKLKAVEKILVLLDRDQKITLIAKYIVTPKKNVTSVVARTSLDDRVMSGYFMIWVKTSNGQFYYAKKRVITVGRGSGSHGGVPCPTADSEA